MDGGKKVWVPDNEHGFRLGEIVDLGSDTITVEIDGAKGKVRACGSFHNFVFDCLVRLSLSEIIKADNIFSLHLQVVTAPYDRVFPSEKDNTRDFEDNCKHLGTCHLN